MPASPQRGQAFQRGTRPRLQPRAGQTVLRWSQRGGIVIVSEKSLVWVERLGVRLSLMWLWVLGERLGRLLLKGLRERFVCLLQVLQVEGVGCSGTGGGIGDGEGVGVTEYGGGGPSLMDIQLDSRFRSLC